jgi:hypothetical protein
MNGRLAASQRCGLAKWGKNYRRKTGEGIPLGKNKKCYANYLPCIIILEKKRKKLVSNPLDAIKQETNLAGLFQERNCILNRSPKLKKRVVRSNPV